MGTPDLLKVHVFSEQRHLSQIQDHETNIIVELEPHRALRSIARDRSAAPHVGFILDCSGSMYQRDALGEQYVDQMIRAACNATAQLGHSDLASVLFFSKTVSPITRLRGSQTEELRATIERAREHPFGNTNMKGALESMIDEMISSPRSARHILLFTDGGPTGSKKAILDLAERAAQAGITVSVCGFNDQLKLPYLSQIATAGNGDTLRSTNERELNYRFEKFTRNAQQTGLTDLTLELTLHHSIVPRHLLRGYPQNQYIRSLKPRDRVIKIPLGSVNAGSGQTIILAGQTLADRTRADQPLVTARVTYRVPSEEGETLHRAETSLSLPVLPHPPRRHRELYEAIQMTLLKVDAYRFEQMKHKSNPEEALTLARQLLRAYEQLGTPEALDAAAAMRRSVESLSQEGDLDLSALNSVSDASTTAVGSVRLSEIINSETRGSSSALGSSRRGSGLRPAQIIDFDI